MVPEEGYSGNIEQKRKSLVDYIRSQTLPLTEHLEYIVNYLHGRLPFVELREHAKNLPLLKVQGIHNINEIVSRLNEQELLVIKNYLENHLVRYLRGKQDFEVVDKALDDIIDLKPIPDTIYAPPHSEFYKGPPGKTLANAREEV